jgi:hypothetical protein
LSKLQWKIGSIQMEWSVLLWIGECKMRAAHFTVDSCTQE